MTLLTKVHQTCLLPHIAGTRFILKTIPRIVCGYLLCILAWADKFGIPWSPVDAKFRVEVLLVSNDVARVMKLRRFFAIYTGCLDGHSCWWIIIGIQFKLALHLFL
jgi:hypothetical protein